MHKLQITGINKCIFYISDDKNCPVCLKNFEQDDIVNTLPCNHRFHSDCIKKWLEKVFETKYKIVCIQFNEKSLHGLNSFNHIQSLFSDKFVSSVSTRISDR